MQRYELNGKAILLVPIPETVGPRFSTLIPGKYGYSIAFSTLKKRSGKLGYFGPKIPLPEGEWRFVGATDTITEAQVAEIVESSGNGYEDYMNEFTRFTLHTALDSFRSWLTANGITGNHALLIRTN